MKSSLTMIFVALAASASHAAAQVAPRSRLADGQREDYPVKFIPECPATQAFCGTEDDCTYFLRNKANPLIGAVNYDFSKKKRSTNPFFKAPAHEEMAEAALDGGASPMRAKNRLEKRGPGYGGGGGTQSYSTFDGTSIEHDYFGLVSLYGSRDTDAYYCDRTQGAGVEGSGQCKLRQVEGSSCNTDAQCLSYSCVSGVCASCHPRARTGLRKSGGGAGTAGNRCRKVDRAELEAANMCDEGLYCDLEADFRCLPKIAAGERCNFARAYAHDSFGDNQCADGLVCRVVESAQGFTCAPPRVEGDWCKVTSVPAFNEWFVSISNNEVHEAQNVLMGSSILFYDLSPCPEGTVCSNTTTDSGRFCAPPIPEGGDCFNDNDHVTTEAGLWPYRHAPGNVRGGCADGLFCNSTLQCQALVPAGSPCTVETEPDSPGSSSGYECALNGVTGVGMCLPAAAGEDFNTSTAICYDRIPEGYEVKCTATSELGGRTHGVHAGCAEGLICTYDNSVGENRCLPLAQVGEPCSANAQCGMNLSIADRTGQAYCNDGWCKAFKSVNDYEPCDGAASAPWFIMPIMNYGCKDGSVCVDAFMWPPLATIEPVSSLCVPLSDIRATSRGELNVAIDNYVRFSHAQDNDDDTEGMYCEQSGYSIESMAESIMVPFSATCYDSLMSFPFARDAAYPESNEVLKILTDDSYSNAWAHAADVPADVATIFAKVTCCSKCSLGTLLENPTAVAPTDMGVDCDTLTLFEVPEDCCGTDCVIRNCGKFITAQIGGTILKEFEDSIKSVGDGAVEASDSNSAGFVKGEPDDSLSGGIIALIIIIVLVVLVLIAVGVALLISKMKDKKNGGGGGSRGPSATEMQPPQSPRTKKDSMAGPSSPRGKNPERTGLIGGDKPDIPPATETEAATPAQVDETPAQVDEAPAEAPAGDADPETPATLNTMGEEEEVKKSPDLPPPSEVAE